VGPRACRWCRSRNLAHRSEPGPVTIAIPRGGRHTRLLEAVREAVERAGRRRRRRGSATVLPAMLVAELTEWHLARRYPNGGTARWYTEQDVRDGVEWLPLPHRRGRYCLPDGVLELATRYGHALRPRATATRYGHAPHVRRRVRAPIRSSGRRR
jgi:hypothetical protein